MSYSVEHGMVVRRIGDGPRVVWIHGLGESSVSFESIVARLAGYTHVLVDLPGCGRAPWPETAPGIDEVAERIATWLGGEPPAVLVGHSLGGVLVRLVAERTELRGVLDIEGNVTRGDCTFSAQAQAYSLDDFAAHGFAALRDGVWQDGGTQPALRLYHAALCFASPQVFHRHACELVERSERGMLAARFGALPMPRLFVAGERGVCAESRTELERVGVPCAVVEGAGHWVYWDRPEEFAAIAREFLQSATR